MKSQPMIKRAVKQHLTFDVTGTFESMYAAEKWCYDNGYSCGSHCAGLPTAIWKGDFSISKWYNLSEEEQNSCDGIMMCRREGPATITIYDND